MDRLTKSTHFLAVQMTFTLERVRQLYIQDIIRLHGVPVSIVSDKVYSALLEEFPKGYGHTTDHEYNFSPTDRWSVKEDHTGVGGHVTSMRPGS